MKLAELKHTYKAQAVIDSDFVIERRAAIIDDITRQVAEQGGETYIQNNCLYIKNSGQYFRLPTMDRVRNGIITFRSKDFVFSYIDSVGKEHASYCEKPQAADMTENGFVTVNMRGEKTTWTLKGE